jgi:4-hydroxy-2-oxoheptanedioate aldolase
MTARRTLQHRMTAQRALIGLLQAQPNVVLAEMAAMCGYDFLMLDDEHGVFGPGDHVKTLQAVGRSEMAVLVRLSGHDTQALARYLDLGVDGIVVPNVTTPEQAIALVRAMSYPPSGTRGFGASLHRGTRYGLDLAEHLRAPRAGASLIVIIESAKGVANVEDIFAIGGVDGAIVGPWDLSADLGCMGNFSDPIYAEALTRVERAASTHGKVLGTAPHPAYSAETLLARGHRLLIAGADMPLMREAMSATLARVKACL